MEIVTLVVAGFAATLVMAFPLRYTLIVYVLAITLYPGYLMVNAASINFSVGRLIMVVVFLKIMITPGVAARFRWNMLDFLVIAAGLGEMISGCATGDPTWAVQNRAGQAFDTILPYLAFRFIVTDFSFYWPFLKTILAMAVPLAIGGLYEMSSGSYLFGFMRAAAEGEATNTQVLGFRNGWWRATMTFPMSIMFGLFFSMMIPICLPLWMKVKSKLFLVLALLISVCGLVSSMSSGPMTAGGMALAVIAVYPVRRYKWVFIAMIVLGIFAVEVISNRAWYEVMASYATLNADTAYYRIGLIKEALGGGMSGNWLLGYGAVGVGGSMEIWHHNDITNHYILILARFGLLAAVPFLAATIYSLVRLRSAAVAAAGITENLVVWTLAGSMAGIIFAMFSVSLFGQPVTYLYILMALACNAELWMTGRLRRRRARTRLAPAPNSETGGLQ